MILIETIRKKINKWDPIGLFDSYCPPDEYESEIQDIFNIVNGRKIDENELGRIIFGVFIYYFDTTFINSIQECIEIAREILNQSE